MKSFYWDIFLMLLTYGILTFLSIRLMKSKRRNGGGNDNGGSELTDQPIIPQLPDGVIWPVETPEEEPVY